MAPLIKFIKAHHWKWEPLAVLAAVALVLAVFTPLGNALWSEALVIGGSITTGEWPTPTPPGQSGTTLAAEKTAEGFYDGDVAGVRGEICVSNGGERATEGLMIVDQVQYRIGNDKEKDEGDSGEGSATEESTVVEASRPEGDTGQFQDLPGASVTIIPIEQIGPGGSQCYAYEIVFAPVPDAKYRNVAIVTIANHSGWMPGGNHCPGPEPCPFGPEPKADFDLPEALVVMIATETPTATETETPTPTPTETPTVTPTFTPSPTATPVCPEGQYFDIPMDRCWWLTPQPDT